MLSESDLTTHWSDISLGQRSSSNINMTPPELGQAIKRPGSFWSRRTGLEKALVFIVGVCGLALVAGSAFIAVTQTSNSPNEDSPYMDDKQDDICTTAECTVAAGVIIGSMNMDVEPCQDFWNFACGGWIENNEIPEAKSRWGKFYELRDAVDKSVRKIVEAPEAEGEALSVTYLKAMYKGCLNLDAINKVGYTWFVEQLNSASTYGGWPMILNSWDQAKFSMELGMGLARRYYNEALIATTFVYLDDFDVSKNVIYMDQPDLALPRDMYLDTESYAEYITAYKNFMVETALVMTRETGDNVPEEKLRESAEAVFMFETFLAKISIPEEDRRNATELYNPTTLDDFITQYPLDWNTYFSAVFVDTGVFIDNKERLIIKEPEYFQNLLAVLNATPDSVKADYLFWRIVMSFAAEGPQELLDIVFRFTGTLQGTTQAPPRWNTCVAKASSDYTGFGMAVGHEYIREKFDETAKEEVNGLVNNLRNSFKELVGESLWMDSETQVKAKDKADAMLQLLGYPDWLPDKAELDKYFEGVIPPTEVTHLINVMDMKSWVSHGELSSLRKDPERNVWLTQPAIVNAFYSPNHNSITFPAGILQPPFFGNGYPRYLNYGAIGVVIGHEITHGFDDQGRQYDGSGNALPWWSEETIEAFTKQAQCFVDQYGNYSVPELIPILGEADAHLNGKATQGENIADNGGVHESFRAYMLSVENEGQEPRLPGLTQYTPNQMFFISYAQVWCEKATVNGLLSQVLTDPHSPGKFRVFGPLSNSEDFVREFNCPAGSPMNRQDKCLLW